jgi:hypothetical protein
MTIKGLSSLLLFAGVVLFSYAAANAQNTPASTSQPTTASNPRVVVTDNLAKPATPASSTATTPKTSTQSYGNHNVTVTEGVTGINLENGKYLTVTKWDGSKWVTKREWVANAPKPNP